jgi:predicted transcriptional regulator
MSEAAETAAQRRDAEAVSRFVEELTFALVQMGFPRMPARVLAALFTTDSGRLTAAELAAGLQASPAAISGAARYLIQIDVIRREGEPGSRRHFYRVPDNMWEEVSRSRDRLMSRWAGVMRGGVSVFGADTPAGSRLAGTADYLDFVGGELPQVLRRWQQHKAALNGQAEPDSSD